jgi:hypothetical protein
MSDLEFLYWSLPSACKHFSSAQVLAASQDTMTNSSHSSLTASGWTTSANRDLQATFIDGIPIGAVGRTVGIEEMGGFITSV